MRQSQLAIDPVTSIRAAQGAFLSNKVVNYYKKIENIWLENCKYVEKRFEKIYRLP